MINKILKALAENNIDNYLIKKVESTGIQLYYIKKNLDMRRMTEEEKIEVTVYNDFYEKTTKMRGSSTVNIFEDMSESEIASQLKNAYYAASFVKNPYYELISGPQKDSIIINDEFKDKSLSTIINEYVEALYKADNLKEAFINSAEFFVTKQKTFIYNSNKIDVSYENINIDGEFVVQCLKPKDVEQYEDFHYIDMNTSNLTNLAKDSLERVIKRANATGDFKSGNYNVILAQKEMYDLLALYINRANASNIYPGYSNYKKGINVQGSNVIGENLNITLKSLVPYSSEGIEMKDLELIKDGELKNIYGNAKFSYYMNIEPRGIYNKIVINNGSVSFEDMKKEPYLYVVKFSDFNMDVFSGYFGGEIRLAYLFDGEKITPVTGGCVNGNLLKLQKDMVFSTEVYKDYHYEGPLAVKLKDVPVAGI